MPQQQAFVKDYNSSDTESYFGSHAEDPRAPRPDSRDEHRACDTRQV